MITSMTLYHFSKSRSSRVLWALFEVGAMDFDVVDINLMAGEHLHSQFLKINPNHAVPVLEVNWADGTFQHIYESTAIVLWVADTFTDSGIAPPLTDYRQRADYLQMVHYAGTSFDSMLWQMRIHLSFLGQDSDAKTIERYRAKIMREVEPTLLSRLQDSPYITGYDFTAADIIMGHCIGWARAYDLCESIHFEQYLNRLSSREAYAKAFE